MSDLLGEILEGRAQELWSLQCEDARHDNPGIPKAVCPECLATALRAVAEEVVRRIVVEIEQESSEVHSWREGKLAVLKTGDDIRSLFPTAFGAE